MNLFLAMVANEAQAQFIAEPFAPTPSLSKEKHLVTIRSYVAALFEFVS